MWCVLQSGFMKFIQIQRNYIRRNCIDTVHAITNVVFHRPSQTQHWWCDLNLYMPNPFAPQLIRKIMCPTANIHCEALRFKFGPMCPQFDQKTLANCHQHGPTRTDSKIVWSSDKKKKWIYTNSGHKKHKMVSWSATNRSCIDHQQKWSIRVKKTQMIISGKQSHPVLKLNK